MFLSIPLLFARCLPDDFVNPFLPWRAPLAICAALLLVATFALARGFRADLRTRLNTVFAGAVSIGTFGVILAAALIWGASLSFIAWCSPADSREMALQAQLAQAAPAIVSAVVVVTAVLSVAVVGTLLRLRYRAR